MMSANRIKNVAIVGATGRSGRYMADALLKTGKHTVTALTRGGNTNALPAGVLTKMVDYSDPASLVAALQGQDALIITMAVTAPPDQHAKLVQAAADASVPWILPNEWGPDKSDANLVRDVASFEKSAKYCEHIKELGKSSFLSVVTGFWYEWSLGIEASYGFDMKGKKVTLFDDGETKITTSTWPQVGRAVASLLSLPVKAEAGDETKCLDHFRNGMVRIKSFTVSQNEMFDSVLRVTGTKLEDWTVVKEPVTERYTKAVGMMKSGDQTAFARMMYSRVFYPDGCGNFEKSMGLANDVLGLPEEDIDEATKAAVKRGIVNPYA